MGEEEDFAIAKTWCVNALYKFINKELIFNRDKKYVKHLHKIIQKIQFMTYEKDGMDGMDVTSKKI